MNQSALMTMPNKIMSVPVGLSVISDLYAGITPKQFILQKRIYNAEALLQNTQYNINEIAQIVGYDNPLYFSRIFQKGKRHCHLLNIVKTYKKNCNKAENVCILSARCNFCLFIFLFWQVISPFVFYNDSVNRKEMNFHEKQIPQLY